MLSAISGNDMISTDQKFNYINIEHHGITRDRLDTFISSGIVPTISKPTRITHNTAILIDKIYVKMRQPEELVSGMLTVDMSNHLPIFTFIGRPTLRKRRPANNL
ncbi:hypothetical protein LSH36_1280g00036 [Paralvinella palmiformis]|uniref:Uncharacterized protein n=1 Tax=Paralvinella palmiformis TaxID=53620 RepID=A0AAD9IUP0_9ANNE|nr:hypothetical protein LSH36_1280g00036 [Paralvinella palmiformis]